MERLLKVEFTKEAQGVMSDVGINEHLIPEGYNVVMASILRKAADAVEAKNYAWFSDQGVTDQTDS